MLKLKLHSPSSAKRLDAALTALLAGNSELLRHGMVVSRSKVERWIKQKLVSVNGQIASRPSQPIEAGAVIELSIPLESTGHLEPSSAVPFTVIYEDDDVLVIDKPAGVVVHPGAGRRGETLVNGLVHYLGPALARIGGELRPGIVHRLDKDTSGVMVVAKNEPAFASLVQQFKPPRTISRSYLAVTLQLPAPVKGAAPGVISAPIGRHAKHRTKMAVRTGGKEAVTTWKVKEQLKTGFMLEVQIETGRTHQIRVHLSSAHAPILGDPVYGPPLQSLPPAIRPAVRRLARQALHARTLSFHHPRHGKTVQFTAEIPQDLQMLLEALRGREK